MSMVRRAALRAGDADRPLLIGNIMEEGRITPHLLTLSLKELRLHLMGIGATQRGKSRFMSGLLTQKMDRGEQIFVIDPHGSVYDLLFAYSSLLPPVLRQKLSFYDLPYAAQIGLYPGLDILNQGLPPHTVAEGVLESFHRVWTELDSSSALDAAVLHGCAVLIHHQLPITFLQTVLTQRRFREYLLSSMPESETAAFFHQHFDKLERYLSSESASTTRRTSRLTFSPELRYSLSNTLSPNLANIGEALASGQSIIVNTAFPSEASRRLVGVFLLVAVEQAAMRRLTQPRKTWTPCTVFVDEFGSLVSREARWADNILQQSAKVGISLNVCFQNLKQLPEETRDAVLGNCALRLVFQVGKNDAEQLVPYFFQFDPLAVKDITAGRGMSQVSFYSYTDQQGVNVERLLRLEARQAYFQYGPQAVAKIYTPSFDFPEVNREALIQAHQYYLHTLFQPQSAIEGNARLAQFWELARTLSQEDEPKKRGSRTHSPSTPSQASDVEEPTPTEDESYGRSDAAEHDTPSSPPRPAEDDDDDLHTRKRRPYE